MSIFSRFKKAKKAAQEHKKVAAAEAEHKPPPPPYKHVPTHAAQDALAASPVTFTPEETRFKIAEVRKRKSELAMRSQSYNYSGSSSTISAPIQRARSNVSMDGLVIRETTQPLTNLGTPTRTRPSRRTSYDDYSFHPKSQGEFVQTFSHPRDVPMPPSVPTLPRTYRTASRKSSMARMKSPLSTLGMEEEPEDYFSSSSNESGYTAASDKTSSSSVSQKRSSTMSITSNSRRNTIVNFPSLPMPKFVSEKPRPIQAVAEISSPYQSDDERDVKTAKNSLPTWRYEDFAQPTEPPVLVTSHSRRGSFSSLFGRRTSAVA